MLKTCEKNFSKCGHDCVDEQQSAALTAGSVLGDRYVLGKTIGSGGFGITYTAYDTELEKTVAIKEYYPRGVAIRGPDNTTIQPITSLYAEEFKICAERFKNEAEILSSLGDNSEDIIKVYDTFGQNGTFYYVMEYVHGVTLEEYLQKYGKISEGQAVYIADSIASVFGHIHSRSVIHRDLSPNNIMITADGKIKVVDFGNARPFLPDEINSMTVALKPGYAPLEQYQHYGNHGPWIDIYSLGMVLYHALTLMTPDDPMTRLDDDGEFQKALLKLEPKFAAVIRKMAEVKISERYLCSKDLLEDLELADLRAERFDIRIADE